MDYYLIDDFNIIVRHSPGLFEKYVPKIGWIEDPEMIGIFNGDIPYWNSISEEDTEKRIKMLENL